MKRAIMLVTAILVMAANTGVFAEQTASDRNECLLLSRNCKDQVDDIYTRMQRLNREIEKGTRVYTPKELQQLREKLAETQEMLRSMEKPGR
ncbi:hypothetical protein KP004_02045 [Geomonas oryzisoli]|uniref:Uncharacterized protein n=1 Tax=Geomonas oryzisoli TaxID=2847992 RepID=A0ABX8J6P6_9BACT|nr:hypothetical protein [Geomonas oryzisoli]QWV93993.1 hypothetical protein KP004_02045 [Geomonas oryzisoli]